MLMERFWINCPSTNNKPFNHYHGSNVLASKYCKCDEHTIIYFTSGALISMIFPTIYLAEGWKENSHAKQLPNQ
jgi:hypothetical protein